MAKLFILYDGRAKSGDTDNATALSTATSEREARRDKDIKDDWDGVWFQYDDVKGELVNPKRRDDL